MDGFNIRGMPFTQASASAAPVIAIGSAATSRYAAVGRPCRPPPVRTGSSSTPEAPPEREMAKGAAECAPVPGWRRRNWSQRHTPFQHYGTAVLNLTCYMDGELGRAPAKIGGVQVAVVKLRRENGNIALRLSF